MKDQLQLKSTALPAANANGDSAVIDLTKVDGGFGNNGRLVIRVPATPALVNAKKITFNWYDSADNSSFALVPGLQGFIITGPASGGGVATVFESPFPQSIRRYIKTNAAVESGGGDSTGVSYTMGVEI